MILFSSFITSVLRRVSIHATSEEIKSQDQLVGLEQLNRFHSCGSRRNLATISAIGLSAWLSVFPFMRLPKEPCDAMLLRLSYLEPCKFPFMRLPKEPCDYLYVLYQNNLTRSFHSCDFRRNQKPTLLLKTAIDLGVSIHATSEEIKSSR